MKTKMRSLFLYLLLCLCVSELNGSPQMPRSTETLNVGADLTLGMPEDTAIKLLTESGYSPRKSKSLPDAMKARV